jgi:hypothetical protein
MKKDMKWRQFMPAKRFTKFKTWWLRQMALFLMLILGGCLYIGKSAQSLSAGKLVSYVPVEEFTARDVADAIQDDFSKTGMDITELVAASTGIKAYSIEYGATNINGALIVVSGLVAVPSPAPGDYPVVQYHHGTQFNNQDVPSNPDRSPEALGCMAVFAGHGYILSLPDYIGQGKSMVKHPYLHIESVATSSAEMLKAVKELCNRLGIKTNSKLFIIGHSQGGQATLALQKYMETSRGIVQQDESPGRHGHRTGGCGIGLYPRGIFCTFSDSGQVLVR